MNYTSESKNGAIHEISGNKLNSSKEPGANRLTEKLALLVDSIPSVIIYIDKDLQLHYVNNAFDTTFNVDQHSIHGRSIADFIGFEGYYCIKNYIDNGLFESHGRCEWEALMNNVSRYFEATFTSDIDNDGTTLGYLGFINDFTEKKKVETALRRKQHELQDYVDNAVTSLHWVDGNGVIIWANKAELDMLGYSAEEYIGHNIADFYVSKEKIDDVLKRLSSNESLHQYEAELVCKDGSVRYVLIDSNVFWEDGRFIHTRCFTTDITERKKLLDALSKSENNYREMFKQAPIGLTIYKGADYTIEFINDFALELTGTSEYEVLHKPLFDLYPELLRQGYKEILDNILTTGQNFVAREQEIYFHKGNSETRGWFNLVVEPFRDDDNNIIGIMSMSTDVTEQVQARKKIEENRHFQEVLLESLPHAVYSCDKDGWINYYNKTAAAVWGFEPGKEKRLKYCAFKNVWLTDGTHISAENTPMATAVETGETFQNLETVFESHDGRRFCALVNISPIFDNTGNLNGAINIFQDISERKKTEQALKESEQRYRNLIQGLPAAVYTTNSEGVITLFNQAAVELWGRKPEVGKDLWCGSWKIFELDGVTPLPLDKCPMAIALKQKRKVICTEPFIVERPDGSRRYFIPHPEPIFDFEGNLAGAVNMLVDVTESKLAEINKAKLAAIIQTSNDAIISKTIDGVITSWNPAAEGLFGYSEKEAVGMQISMIIPPDHLSEEIEIISRIRNGERITHFETKRITKTKTLIDVSLTISPIKDDRGNIIGISKIVRDITTQKALAEAIREGDLRLKIISDASPVGLWMTDANAQNIFVNDTWIQWTGLPFEQQLGTGWLNRVVEEDRTKAPAQFWECLLKQEKYTCEFRLMRKDGELRWCLTEGSPYYNADGEFAGYAGSVTDITDMKKMEERKDDFIKMASHELKTPITSINGYIQLLLKIHEETENEKFEKSKLFVKTSLQTVAKQITKLTRLISELLDLSKIESGRLELSKTNFSLHELLKETIEDVRHTTSRHEIILHNNFAGTVHADRDRISQVLLNLFTNAIKYSPNGGCINVFVEKEENMVSVSVQDYGIGIDKNEHDLIFQRFYRSAGKNEQTFPGFGIGLFIANEIIQRHNGNICVDSKKNQGSTFTVKLPVT